MSETQFESAIRRLVARAELLRQARSGSVRLVAVQCKGARAHWVKKGRPHTRYIAPVGWRKNNLPRLKLAA